MVGNISNYTKTDILRAFIAIMQNENISRDSLSKKLDIGEGTMRTILGVLKKKGLIVSDQNGHKIGGKGKALSKKIQDSIVMKNNISIDFYKEMNFKNTALLVKKGVKLSPKLGILHRDMAIKNGADSCLMFAYKNKELTMPFLEIKNDFEGIAEVFDFSEGDILIVTFAHTQRWAEISALAVAENLVGKPVLDV